MKKFTFAVALAVAFNWGFAQKDYNPESVKAKAEKSNSEIADAKSGSNYKTWLKRADIFGEIAEAPLAGAYPGMSEKEADLLIGKANSTSTVEINGKPVNKMEYAYVDFFFEGGKLLFWTIKDSGVDKPLVIGFEAIQKAVALDPKAEKKAKNVYTNYKNFFFKAANNAYNAGNKPEAALNYRYAYQCSVALNIPDTTTAYYAAYSSIEGKDYEEALKYAQICLDNKCFQNGDVYRIIGEAHTALKNGEKAKEAYLKGLELYPSNTVNIFGIINLCLSQNEDPKTIIPYVDKAIQMDQKNPSLYNVKGSFYEKFKEFDNAIAAYAKALEINPDYYDAWVNMGISYYNKGLEIVNESNKVDPNNQKEFDRLTNLSNEQFKSSLEKFLKAYSINPKDKFVVETIKNIYFRFRNDNAEMKQKYEEFNKVFESLQ